ncbi:hypothetical protein [Candidatus Poriferisodalis multihospitum]|uniref:hypothetical protein n=1 Tax=Candidatus Poriferisodalis multihospitum TaxID=2983191 RepID=UPI00238ABFC3|nr:hypothetical protein [Candidatus Poriferisodalis multihospitum]MDE0133694.1 hypothetical protein [Acidimicrobiaceae bacterium]
MRTTIEFEDDVALALSRLRRDSGMGVSEAANFLIRQGLTAPARAERFVQQTRPLGVRIDVSNVAEALELIDGPMPGSPT